MDTAGEHFKHGKDHYYNNEFEDAAIEFEQAIRLDCQNKDYFYWCGLAYYENEDYEEVAIKVPDTNIAYMDNLTYYVEKKYYIFNNIFNSNNLFSSI